MKTTQTQAPRSYADMTTVELTLALAQLMQRLGALPPAHATAVWGEAAKIQTVLARREQGGAV